MEPSLDQEDTEARASGPGGAGEKGSGPRAPDPGAPGDLGSGPPGEKGSGTRAPDPELPGEKGPDPPPRNTHRRDTILGSVAALLAAITITIASGAVQGLQQRWPDMELNIFRWAFMMIVLGVFFTYKRDVPSIPRKKIPYVLFYGTLVSGEQVIFFAAVNFLPLGLMAALFRISLVTMAAIASRLIEKERLTLFRLTAVVLGIVGIILMTQPAFIFGAGQSEARKESCDETSPDVYFFHKNSSSSVGNYNVLEVNNVTSPGSHTMEQGSSVRGWGEGIGNYTEAPEVITTNLNTSCVFPQESNHSNEGVVVVKKETKSLISTAYLSEQQKLSIGVALTVFAAFLGILQGICMKRRILTDYSVWKIAFWVATSGLIWTTILSFSLEDVVFVTSSQDLALVACYAILASAHSLTFLYAVKTASYLIVAVIMVTQIVFNLIAQYTVLNNIFPGKHNVVEIVGGVLVVIAAALPTVTEGLRRQPPQKVTTTTQHTRGKLYTLSNTQEEEETLGMELSAVVEEENRSSRRNSSAMENGSVSTVANGSVSAQERLGEFI